MDDVEKAWPHSEGNEAYVEKHCISISWDRITAAVDARSQALRSLDHDVVLVMAWV